MPHLLAVADCTSHGVAGAMLSLLMSHSLERIFAKFVADEPTKALTSLDYFKRSGLNRSIRELENFEYSGLNGQEKLIRSNESGGPWITTVKEIPEEDIYKILCSY